MASYPLHSDVLDSVAVEQTYRRFGSFLLPQAYPEGCPLHPAYPSGHATVAGACATILKAFFDEDLAVPDCVVPSRDGQSLLPYKGPALTVRGEIEKLAFNVAFGRNFAGIHWRSDSTGGVIDYVYDPVGNILEIRRSTSPPGNLTIFSFTPGQGGPLTGVTIRGQGFANTAASNVVAFNGKVAAVLSATRDTLVASV